LPVLKENGVAVTGAVNRKSARTVIRREVTRIMFSPPAYCGASQDVTAILSHPHGKEKLERSLVTNE
jgi:hypothetical protein